MKKRIETFLKWPFRNRLRRWIFVWIPFSFLAVTIICDQIIERNAEGRIYNSIAAVPNSNAALVLGTSPKLKGKVNLFYLFRMQAAADLWKAGKVKYIIVSGDNSTMQYDEATAMKKTLNKLGVPDSVITLDYAGFRTLDSVVRAYWVFGQKNIVIVSQEFHNERALYLADHFGLHAVALNAKDVPQQYSIKTSIREYFARVKAVMDIHLLGALPKFTGPPEPIGFPAGKK